MRLLVVEDEKHLNKTLTERLTKIGYTVDSCFDGEDALYYIENTQYDGIILDVMMPKINGFEVLKTMRGKKILTPALMLTAKDSDEDIINGLDLGANDYLTKPFSFDVLCARIRAMLRVKENVTSSMLEIADLTVDGSICTGACVCAVLLALGIPVWVCVIAAFVAGALTGVCTGLLHTALGIPAILAGILTQLMLYSVNLTILGGKSLATIDPRANNLAVNMSDNPKAIMMLVIIVALVILCLYLFFYTEVGLTLKSTGDNPDMSRAQGVNVNLNKVVGLAISNGIVALAGTLLAQYKGFANINDGRGAIVIGLAAIFIGLSVSMKIKDNFVCSLVGVVCGGVIYYIVYNVVILMGLKTDFLKMLSAIIVIIFLSIPYLKDTYFNKKVVLPIPPGGEENA